MARLLALWGRVLQWFLDITDLPHFTDDEDDS